MSLEPIETRYTAYWLTTFPNQIEKFLKQHNLIEEYEIINLTGDEISISNKTTEGAFLNFIETNFWKNTQMNRFIHLIEKGQIHKGDKIVFMDAWHNGIIQCKYLSDLLDLELEIHAVWHAGSYDPQDFLGRKIKDKKWSFAAEESFFYTSTKNYFATFFHWEMIRKALFLQPNCDNPYIHTDDLYPSDYDAYIVGFPFDYLQDICKPSDQKEDIILFPHRIAPEKQPEIFEDLAKSLPQYKFIFCQKEHLTKDMYYDLLKRAKIVFSANLQETLGISCYEGLLCDAIPFVPNRLSYPEIYGKEFCYKDEWTNSYENYLNNKESVVTSIDYLMKNYTFFISKTEISSIKEKAKKFFTSDKMLSEIFNF